MDAREPSMIEENGIGERDLNDEEIDRDPIGRIFVREEFEDIRNPRAFEVLMREKKKKEDSEMVRCEGEEL